MAFAHLSGEVFAEIVTCPYCYIGEDQIILYGQIHPNSMTCHALSSAIQW